MYLNIVFLPFFGSLFAGIFGRFLGPHGSSMITTCTIGLVAMLSICAFHEVSLCATPCYLKLANWINVEYFYNDWGFLFDTLTVTMLVVVTFVSTLVHLYSTEYMSHDPHLPRFMSYLSLFTAFMIVLVTADNYIQMFFGWEGIGLASYLLINFWFTRLQANKAAIKAMVINRIGDFGLALGIFFIYTYFSTVEYNSVFAIAHTFKEIKVFFIFSDVSVLTLIGILLFIGAIGKSAQLGLHTWLPDAMEGPTPVSALIHAATLVTAGVFLIARSSPILESSDEALVVIALFGALTAFFAATTGLLQNDLKRVIAYSTCSQLGYMVFACGLSNYSTAVFHLANHAFFKALLFLSAGSVIHGVQDEQDMRKMGGLLKLIPFTYAMVFIGSFSLMGLPFLTGYYSKDFILEVAYAKYTVSGHFCYWLGCFGAFFTAFYSIRLIFLTFLSEPNGFKPVIVTAHDAPIRMGLPLAILAIPSIFIGYFTQDMIIGMGTDFWGNALYIAPTNLKNIEAEFIPFAMKILPVILSISGGALAYLLYSYNSRLMYDIKVSSFGRKLYTFLNRKWFFDKVYNEFIAQSLFVFSYSVTYKIIDRGLIEIFGPRGLSGFVFSNARTIQNLQTGYIYHYSFFILVGASAVTLASIISSFSFFLLDYKIFIILLTSIFVSNFKRIR